jgi:hypothetical protein
MSPIPKEITLSEGKEAKVFAISSSLFTIIVLGIPFEDPFIRFLKSFALVFL